MLQDIFVDMGIQRQITREDAHSILMLLDRNNDRKVSRDDMFIFMKGMKKI